MSIRLWTAVVGALATVIVVGAARAQNPIQWSGNARVSIERARELSLPLMFWVEQRSDLVNEDDLRDEQEHAFRDPVVSWLAHERFIPVRVARNSRVLEEAAQLGLPTQFGLYVALITPEGEVLDRVDPGDVAVPGALAERLAAASRKYRDEMYQREYKAILTSKEAPKEQVRRAVQAVWRLGMFSADRDVVALLDRTDLKPTERTRLYTMIGAMATKPCIAALLDRAAGGDKDAVNALSRAETGALEWLLPELAAPDAAERTARQAAAYEAVVRLARAGSPRPDAFWKNAGVDERTKEMDRLQRRAEAVLDYWKENSGRWR